MNDENNKDQVAEENTEEVVEQAEESAQEEAKTEPEEVAAETEETVEEEVEEVVAETEENIEQEAASPLGELLNELAITDEDHIADVQEPKNSYTKLIIIIVATAVIVAGLVVGGMFGWQAYDTRDAVMPKTMQGAKLGNTIENTTNMQLPGVVTTDGEWTYFAAINLVDEKTNIYKQKADGSERKLLIAEDAVCIYLNVVGGNLYYQNRGKSEISRVSTNGGASTTVVESAMGKEQIISFVVANGNIIYSVVEQSEQAQEIKTYMVRCNGKGKKQVDKYDGKIYLTFVGDKVIFIEAVDGKLCSMNIDGSDVKVLSDVASQGYTVKGDYIYNMIGTPYTIKGTGKGKNKLPDSQGQQMDIYRMKLDGSDNKKLLENALILYVTDDKLFATKVVDKNDPSNTQTITTDLEGQNETVLPISANGINLAGDRIFYLHLEETPAASATAETPATDLRLYSAKLDGTDAKELAPEVASKREATPETSTTPVG